MKILELVGFFGLGLKWLDLCVFLRYMKISIVSLLRIGMNVSSII